MKQAFAIYWIIGCLLIGAADGYHHRKCPLDPEPSSVELLASIAIWIGVFGYGWQAGDINSQCKVG